MHISFNLSDRLECIRQTNYRKLKSPNMAHNDTPGRTYMPYAHIQKQHEFTTSNYSNATLKVDKANNRNTDLGILWIQEVDWIAASIIRHRVVQPAQLWTNLNFPYARVCHDKQPDWTFSLALQYVYLFIFSSSSLSSSYAGDAMAKRFELLFIFTTATSFIDT